MKKNNKLALIISFYLSKFDFSGVGNLGYKNFSDAFRKCSDILDVKVATLKQMREQFDPYHENNRVGWYQRPLSRSRQDVMNQFGGLSEAALREIVLEILKTISTGKEPNENYTKYISDIENHSISKESSSAYTTRGITGQSAEELFLEMYNAGEIQGFTVPLKDTRLNGTGYDFEMNGEPNCVFEVKGLLAEKGSVLFTDHEWKTAQNLKDRYFVVLLSNLGANVKVSIVQNPYKRLQPKMQLYPTMQVNWYLNTEEFY